MSNVGKIFDIFGILRSILRHFRSDVREYVFEKPTGYSVQPLLNGFNILTGKHFKKYTQRPNKVKMSKYFDFSAH